MATKRCCRCGEEKPLTEFSKYTKSKDGRRGHCRVCASKASKEYHAKNKEALNAHGRERYAKNKEARRAAERAYYAKNKEERKIKRKAWYEANKERELSVAKAYREKNRDKRLQQNKVRYRENWGALKVKHQQKHASSGRVPHAKSPVTANQLDEMLSKTHACPCCGRELVIGSDDRWNSPSVDRINNNFGYEDWNVWIICMFCNARKGDASSPDDLINIANAWAEKQQELWRSAA